MPQCKQCKRTLPDGAFLPIRKRRWKVTKCDDCARANMAKWARTALSNMTPDKIKEADE
jgi:hypothetical protein